MASDVARQPAQYYPGQTTVGPTDAERRAWSTRTSFLDSIFGPGESGSGGSLPSQPFPQASNWQAAPQTPALPAGLDFGGMGGYGGWGGWAGIPGVSAPTTSGGPVGTPIDPQGRGESLGETLSRWTHTTGAPRAPGFGQANQANQAVPGAAETPFAQMLASLRAGASGATPLGGLANSLAPEAIARLGGLGDLSGLMGPGAGSAGSTAALIGGGGGSAAGRIRDPSFNTALEIDRYTPTFGVAGDLDARGAFRAALGDTPDYAGAQRAVDAANAPVLRQFNEEILPGLNQRSNFTGGTTGGVKALNRVLPALGERMSANAGAIMEGERQRALGARERAASAIAAGGLQGYGLGLQGALGARGLERDLAGLRLSADTSRAGFDDAAANRGLQASIARAGAAQADNALALQRDVARSDFGLRRAGLEADTALGIGGLAGNLAGADADARARALALFPTLVETGRLPGQEASAYAQWDRAIREDALAGDIGRFEYYRDYPRDLATWYSQIANGMGGLGGTSTTRGATGGGSRASGALGGALAGAQLGSIVPGLGTGIGAILGGLAGLF